MKQISGKEMCKLLTLNGWSLARIKGSHHIFTHADNKLRISVPVHGNTPLKIGLLNHILKISGITIN